MKLRATMVPEQALVEGKGGTSSRNVAASYADIFLESLAAEAAEDDDDWNRLHIPKIVEANWGTDAPEARKVTTGFEEEDIELAKSLIETAFSLDPNALPINFNELLKKVKLPVYSAKEQEEREEQREEEAEEAKVQAEQQGPENEEQAADEGNEPAQQKQLSQQPGRFRRLFPGARRKKKADDTIVLDDHGDKVAAGKISKAQRREFQRRNRNQRQFQSRMEHVSKQRYAAAFLAMSQAVGNLNVSRLKTENEDSATAAKIGIFLAIKKAGLDAAGRYDRALQAELASMYHAAGASELQKLGVPIDSWDIAREDVQHWAQDNAGRLIKTMDATMVDNHVRPWLAEQFEKAESEGVVGIDYSGIDTEAMALRMSQKFEGYPLWMSERVARTESRMGYNQSALDMYERIGVDEVQAYDGLGGKSGKTDEVCLRRNGEIMTLAEARKADEEEHPNGTFGVVPYVTQAKLAELKLEPGVLAMDIVRSDTPYEMDADGLILDRIQPA
jgi:ribosomal protein S30